MALETITARLDAYLRQNGLPHEMEDARLYRHNTRKGLAFAADPELSALCRRRAMAAALRIRLAARRVCRAQKTEAARAERAAAAAVRKNLFRVV